MAPYDSNDPNKKEYSNAEAERAFSPGLSAMKAVGGAAQSVWNALPNFDPNTIGERLGSSLANNIRQPNPEQMGRAMQGIANQGGSPPVPAEAPTTNPYAVPQVKNPGDILPAIVPGNPAATQNDGPAALAANPAANPAPSTYKDHVNMINKSLDAIYRMPPPPPEVATPQNNMTQGVIDFVKTGNTALPSAESGGGYLVSHNADATRPNTGGRRASVIQPSGPAYTQPQYQPQPRTMMPSGGNASNNPTDYFKGLIERASAIAFAPPGTTTPSARHAAGAFLAALSGGTAQAYGHQTNAQTQERGQDVSMRGQDFNLADATQRNDIAASKAPSEIAYNQAQAQAALAASQRPTVVQGFNGNEHASAMIPTTFQGIAPAPQMLMQGSGPTVPVDKKDQYFDKAVMSGYLELTDPAEKRAYLQRSEELRRYLHAAKYGNQQ